MTWHQLLTSRLIAYFFGILVLLIVAIKARAIEASGRAIVDWFSRKIQKKAPTDPRARTYKGKFQGFYRYSNYLHEWFVTLLHKGVTTKVPTLKTNLLTGVQIGATVEIDTQVLPGAKVELVRRVRRT